MSLEKRTYSSKSVILGIRDGGLLGLFGWFIASTGLPVKLGFLLAARDIKAKYRGAVLGFFWYFLPIIVTTLVFVVLNMSKILNVAPTGMPYVLYAFTGAIFWQTVTESITKPLEIVAAESGVMSKVQFPKSGLLFSALFQQFFNFGVRYSISIPVIWFFGFASYGLIAVPFFAILIMFFGMAISFLMVPFSLLFKDVQNAIGVFFGLLIFITPVGLKAYPETFLENLMALNPISDLIVFGRMLALSQPMPNFVDLIPLTLFSVLLFLIGLVIFFVVIPIAIERRSA